VIRVRRALVAFVFAAAASVATALGQSYGTVPQSPTQLTIARLHYDGGGDWYANPSSLPNLLGRIAADTRISVARREAVVTPLSPDLRDYPYLYMTGHGNVRFNENELSALRGYLSSGGFLHADDNYGMDASFRREVGRLFPESELIAVPFDHPVYRIIHLLPYGLPKVHEHDTVCRPKGWASFTTAGSWSSTVISPILATAGRTSTYMTIRPRSATGR
jgi:hypothetical protein